MNTNTEELLKQLYKNLKDIYEPTQVKQQKQERWKPNYAQKYGYVDSCGNFSTDGWGNTAYMDNHRHAIGNCYPLDQQERAVWEQVTRRKYDQALRDAADWVSGDGYYAVWIRESKKVVTIKINPNFVGCSVPIFATRESCIETHTRILGNDAKRYFTGEI